MASVLDLEEERIVEKEEYTFKKQEESGADRCVEEDGRGEPVMERGTNRGQHH